MIRGARFRHKDGRVSPALPENQKTHIGVTPPPRAKRCPETLNGDLGLMTHREQKRVSGFGRSFGESSAGPSG
jgi:hypothetical protein